LKIPLQSVDTLVTIETRIEAQNQDVDPDPIDRIRYCVDTVIKAGEEP